MYEEHGNKGKLVIVKTFVRALQKERNIGHVAKGYVSVWKSCRCVYLCCFQKHENRAIVVKPAEQDLWKDIGVDDMSEESDDLGNPNNLIVKWGKWV